MWIKAQAKQSLEETVDREKRERGRVCLCDGIVLDICGSLSLTEYSHTALHSFSQDLPLKNR